MIEYKLERGVITGKVLPDRERQCEKILDNLLSLRRITDVGARDDVCCWGS